MVIIWQSYSNHMAIICQEYTNHTNHMAGPTGGSSGSTFCCGFGVTYVRQRLPPADSVFATPFASAGTLDIALSLALALALSSATIISYYHQLLSSYGNHMAIIWQSATIISYYHQPVLSLISFCPYCPPTHLLLLLFTYSCTYPPTRPRTPPTRSLTHWVPVLPTYSSTHPTHSLTHSPGPSRSQPPRARRKRIPSPVPGRIVHRVNLFSDGRLPRSGRLLSRG